MYVDVYICVHLSYAMYHRIDSTGLDEGLDDDGSSIIFHSGLLVLLALSRSSIIVHSGLCFLRHGMIVPRDGSSSHSFLPCSRHEVESNMKNP